MSLERFVKLIQELDQVKAGVVNVPLRQLDTNIRYVWDVLQAAAVGSTVYSRRRAVEADVVVGSPVYWRPSTGQFERGLAVMDTDQTGGILRPAASAQIWGIVANKINATLADILLFGEDEIDVSAAVTGDLEAGAYYLSGTTPGKLTQQKNPVSVMVLRADGNGRVFVQPQFVDFLDRHTHYRFELACQPAGEHTQPVVGERHQITNPDSTLPGWLPADDGVFAGKAPAQAVWGYNINADPNLKAAWPPIPTTSATLEWDKGLDPNVAATVIPLGEHGLVIIDRNGIWWTSDCYGDVPWPVDFDSAIAGSLSLSDSGGECPRELHMGLTLWFTRPNFATDTTVVTSLRSKSGQIRITCQGTDTEATAGDLDINLDLNLTVKNDEEGYLAIKNFDPDTSLFERGPVVEGIYTTQDNVILSGDATTAIGNNTLYQGKVQLTVLPTTSIELDTELIRLDGVDEDFTEDPPVMFLAFRAGEESEIRGRINVPASLDINSPTLTLRFTVLGRAAGTLPDLDVTYRRVERPSDGLNVPVDLLSGSEVNVNCDFGAVLASADLYVEVDSDPISIEAGDTIYYTVKRLSTDGYAGDVGLLRQGGIVSGS